MLPSGRLPEEALTPVEPDPTWAAEYRHFKELCAAPGAAAGLGDAFLPNEMLSALAAATGFG